MVSPGIQLVKTHEFPSITNESQLKKKRSPKLKMLQDLYVHNQRVNLETDTKTLYYSLLKLIHSPSIYLKHKNDQSKYVQASLNNHKHSLHPMGHMLCQRIIILHLWRFLYIRDAGHRGRKNHCRKHRTTALQVHVCFRWTLT